MRGNPILRYKNDKISPSGSYIYLNTVIHDTNCNLCVTLQKMKPLLSATMVPYNTGVRIYLFKGYKRIFYKSVAALRTIIA